MEGSEGGKMLEIGEQGVKKGLELGAEEIELYITRGREFNVFLENNRLKLGKTQTRDGVGIRVFKNRQLGFASVNTLLKDKVFSAIEDAVRLATVSPSDRCNRLPKPTTINWVSEIYDPASEDLTIDFALKNGEKLLTTALDFDKRITVDSGIFSVSISEYGVCNSLGISLTEKATSIEYMIMGMAIDGKEVSSFQYEFDNTRRLKDVSVEKVSIDFAKKAINSLGASKIGKSFNGTVILEPKVVSLLCSVIVFAVNANNVQKGMSRFAQRLDSQVTSSLLIIEDNGLLPGGIGSSSFDREGVPRKPVKIIEQGILNSFLYNTYTAEKENRESNGHASGGFRNVPGIGITNLLIKPGTKSKDELVREIKEGVYVTRLSGFPNPVSGDFSGVVKGGFLIEDGAIKKPLIETLITGNIFDMLNQVSGISSETQKVGNYLLPYLRIDDVSITSG